MINCVSTVTRSMYNCTGATALHKPFEIAKGFPLTNTLNEVWKHTFSNQGICINIWAHHHPLFILIHYSLPQGELFLCIFYIGYNFSNKLAHLAFITNNYIENNNY